MMAMRGLTNGIGAGSALLLTACLHAGLVINEKVVSSGRIPSPAEITTFLTDALANA